MTDKSDAAASGVTLALYRAFEPFRAESVEGGAWIMDVVVRLASPEQWQAVINARRANYSTRFFIGEDPAPPPSSVDSIFALRDRALPQLDVDVGGRILRTFFFSSSEVDFDFDARDIQDVWDFEDLRRFCEVVGGAAGAILHVAAEGFHERPILEFDNAKWSVWSNENPAQARWQILVKLLEGSIPAAAAAPELAKFGWDSEVELVRVRPVHVVNMLRGYADGRRTAQELEAWASAIEGRDDIGFEDPSGKVRQAIHVLANPVLEGRMGRLQAVRAAEALLATAE